MSRRGEIVVWVLAGIAALAVLFTAYVDKQATTTLALVVLSMIFISLRRTLLAWPTLLGAIVLCILLIPVRRYTLGGGLPFQLEPYRILIALVMAIWIASLLVDPSTRFRRTGLELPLLLYLFAIMGSLAFNVDRVSSLSGSVIRISSIFAGFFSVMYFAAGAINTREQLDRIVKVLASGGALVALATLVEWKNGYNVFNHLERLCPLLDLNESMIPQVPERAGRPRAYASSQHAIALGAAFVMLLPLALYLFKRTNWKPWLGVALLLVMGALATTSRTAVTMLVALLVVFLWIKRRETVRMLPMLLPLILVLQVAMPGTLGTFKAILFPKEGLISEEQQGEGVGTGRVQDLGPSLQEWGRKPLFGEGFGTRLTSLFDKQQNARIVDDQWLSSLLETGAFGVAALLWLIVRAVRRLKLLAKRDDSSFGWLLTGLAGAITAYAVGMVTYDAFSFIQVTFLFFLMLGISGAALALPEANGVPEIGAWPQPLPSLRHAKPALARVASVARGDEAPSRTGAPSWDEAPQWDDAPRWDAIPPELRGRG